MLLTRRHHILMPNGFLSMPRVARYPLMFAAIVAPLTIGVGARAQSGASPVLASTSVAGAEAASASGHRVRHHRARASHAAGLHYETPVGAPALGLDLAAMLNARVRSGQWGALVMSLTRGGTLYSYQ